VYQPLPEADGSVTGIFVHGVDVMEQVRSRRQIEELGQINRTITENATAGLFMVDSGGRCSFMNPAAEAMTGYTLDDVRDLPLHDVVHATYPDGRP
jgi:PAS domain-containing protein